MPRASEGTEDVVATSQRGVYYVAGQTWQVGERYDLKRMLGTGSFSSVCMAEDRSKIEQVAIKRIGDVLNSPDNAKRVLREVCILRRLSHPNIIALKDVFLKPSPTGKFVYRNGSFMPQSLDIYLVTEFCDQGDLFHMKGQLSELEVKHIMWQILNALLYLHANNVWHRDIKSANVLITLQRGYRIVKLADLGSARSASMADSTAMDVPLTSARSSNPCLDSKACEDSDHSMTDPVSTKRPLDSFILDQVQPPKEAQDPKGRRGALRAPLTRVVCTPCYRAPEVVMSRGSYSSAIDMWSVGCVFGELLQRVAHIGLASTPLLQVAPVFAIHGMPKTPKDGERFECGASNPITRQELEALFDVIGTPAWPCIQAVHSNSWRRYLYKIPARAPKLFRRFGMAGEPAVDMLSRFLTFDPARRVSAEEALSHEYFEDYRELLQEDSGAALPAEVLQQISSMDLDAISALSDSEECVLSATPSGTADGECAAVKRVRSTTAHYYDLDVPSQALAALETELMECVSLDNAAGVDRLRQLLEREVAAIAAANGVADAAAAAAQARQPHGENAARGGDLHSPMALQPAWAHLKPDPGQAVASDPSVIGYERIPHHADSEGARLEPEQHLRAGRHGEWTQTSLPGGPRAGPSWGVTLVPPGHEVGTASPALIEVMRCQHAR